MRGDQHEVREPAGKKCSSRTFQGGRTVSTGPRKGYLLAVWSEEKVSHSQGEGSGGEDAVRDIQGHRQGLQIPSKSLKIAFF